MPHEMTGRAASGRRRRGFERGLKILFRDVHHRREAEDNSGEETNAEGEKKNPAVQSDFGGARDAGFARDFQQLQPGACQKQAKHSPAYGEDQAFGEELRAESAQTGTDRTANGDFAMPGFGAGDEKLGDVDASDE